jgi:protein-tyrosine phosphatase
MVAFHIPSHQSVLRTLRLLPGPLVLSGACGADGVEATSAEEVVRAVGDRVDLVIDDGPSHHGQAGTVVRLEGDAWRVLHEGLIPAATLEQLACAMVVFVCTGNTCRSPLAEALFKKLLADRLGCTVAELPRRGFLVLSAGLAAMIGGRAAAEAEEVARGLGADLAEHTSRPLTAELAAHADHLVVMTRSHLVALEAQFPHPGCRPRLLGPAGADVPDPIGFDLPVYQECARQIQGGLEHLLPEVLQS